MENILAEIKTLFKKLTIHCCCKYYWIVIHTYKIYIIVIQSSLNTLELQSMKVRSPSNTLAVAKLSLNHFLRTEELHLCIQSAGFLLKL